MRVLVLVLAAFVARQAAARSPLPPPCDAAILMPADGQTNVAPDAVLRLWMPACIQGQPTLLDGQGAAVPFDLKPSEGACPDSACFDLVTRAPFGVAADYELSLPTTARRPCDGDVLPSRARFHTGPRPTVLSILPFIARGAPSDAEEVVGITIHLSEPIDSAALALDPSLVQVEREDGLPLASRLDDGPDRLALWVTLKVNAVRPPAGTRFRVRIARELKFVSGASLPAASDVTTAYGMREGKELAPCPGSAASPCGCTTVDLATLPLLLGLAARRRRRNCDAGLAQ